MSELTELFLDELSDILYAENLLLKALPKMAKAARSEELKDLFETHLDETEGQIERIKEVFGLFGRPAKGKKCEAMIGLIEEGKTIMEEWKGSAASDAAIISAAQKIEHYEIASYGCLCTWADLIGNKQALRLLKETIDEEESADKKLTDLAESSINEEALEEEKPEEMARPRYARANVGGMRK